MLLIQEINIIYDTVVSWASTHSQGKYPYTKFQGVSISVLACGTSYVTQETIQ